MNKKIVIAAALLLVVIAGFLVLKPTKTSKSTAGQSPVATSTPTPSVAKVETVQATLRSFMTAGKPVSCTYASKINTASVTGKVYLDGIKMRGDFVSTDTSKKENITTHIIINDAAKAYAWTDLTNRGITVSISAKTSPNPTSTTPSLDQVVDLGCESWIPDASVFVVPTTVTFHAY